MPDSELFRVVALAIIGCMNVAQLLLSHRNGSKLSELKNGKAPAPQMDKAQQELPFK